MEFQIMWKDAVVQKASSKGTQIKYYTDGHWKVYGDK